MDHTDFKEARYLEKDWFSTFTLGHDIFISYKFKE